MGQKSESAKCTQVAVAVSFDRKVGGVGWGGGGGLVLWSMAPVAKTTTPPGELKFAGTRRNFERAS